MAAPIIPSAASLLTAAIDAIVAARPEALPHMNSGGRWADLPAIWRAQILLNLARLADEVGSARLGTAKGDALRTLCASEFNTVLPPDPQTAFADIQLGRAPGPQGVIKKGTLFTKIANPDGIPLPVDSATYTTVKTIYCPADSTSVALVAQATSSGAGANVPIWTNYAPSTLIQPSKPLYDPAWTTQVCEAGGGTSGLTDPVLIAAAKAYAIGQFGPTDGAVIAGILRNQSVRHFAAFRANANIAYAQVYLADESWAWTSQWASLITQDFVTNWQGFGCRVRFGLIANQQIAIAPTIVLKSTDDLNNTDDIDDSVRAAAEAYFNDRPDWYRWHAATLQALLSRCDPRIQQCTAVVVTDAVTGAAVPEPPNTFGLTWSAGLTHFYLTDTNCTATYLPPS